MSDEHAAAIKAELRNLVVAVLGLSSHVSRLADEPESDRIRKIRADIRLTFQRLDDIETDIAKLRTGGPSDEHA